MGWEVQDSETRPAGTGDWGLLPILGKCRTSRGWTSSKLPKLSTFWPARAIRGWELGSLINLKFNSGLPMLEQFKTFPRPQLTWCRKWAKWAICMASAGFRSSRKPTTTIAWTISLWPGKTDLLVKTTQSSGATAEDLTSSQNPGTRIRTNPRYTTVSGTNPLVLYRLHHLNRNLCSKAEQSSTLKFELREKVNWW